MFANEISRIAVRHSGLRVAAIVPCHNEELTIGKVVRDLRESVAGIDVFVYDNCSTDDTARVAQAAGATVRQERAKGKGNVVRRAFADIDADVYVLIDGDDTYDAGATPRMIHALLTGPFDHVLGVRQPEQHASDAYRSGHEAGNRALNKVVEVVFGENVGDMLSGFRVFSRRFVKSFAAFSSGFEIETELTVHALTHRVPQTTVPVGFRERPAGSESKLNTYRDGLRILRLIVALARHEKPIAFWGLVGALLAAVSLVVGLPVLATEHPTTAAALVAIATALLALAMVPVGVVLEGMRRNRQALSHIHYLHHAPLQSSLQVPVIAQRPRPIVRDIDWALNPSAALADAHGHGAL